MSAKHTPGPWVAVGQGGTSDGGSTRQWPCFIGEIYAENGQRIIAHGSLLGIRGRTSEQAEANARLIAAAPDLLEALKWCVEHKDECLGDHPIALDALKAKITKAEGE